MQSALGKIAGVLFIFLILGCSQEPSERHIVERAHDNNKLKANAMIGYDEFLVQIEKIRIGNDKDYVETILGEPESKSDIIWNYDLKSRRGFPGIPPGSGTTAFVGFEISFENDQVKDIKRNWIDVTGPAH